MKVFRIELNIDPLNFELIPIFDIHFGSKLHAKSLFNQVLDYIRYNDNVYWFCGGDIAEFIPINDSKKFDYSTIEESFQRNLDRILSYSIEYAVDILEPIKDKCLFFIAGNHDLMHINRFGFDPITSICKTLNIENYTNNVECFCKILFKTTKTYSLDLYAHHGFSNSRRIGSTLNSIETLLEGFLADIFILGHSHSLAMTYKPVLYLNSTGTKLLRKNRLLLRVGGFRQSRKENICGYEEKRGYTPNSIGTFRIKIIQKSKKEGLKLTAIPIF